MDAVRSVGNRHAFGAVDHKHETAHRPWQTLHLQWRAKRRERIEVLNTTYHVDHLATTPTARTLRSKVWSTIDPSDTSTFHPMAARSSASASAPVNWVGSPSPSSPVVPTPAPARLSPSNESTRGAGDDPPTPPPLERVRRRRRSNVSAKGLAGTEPTIAPAASKAMQTTCAAGRRAKRAASASAAAAASASFAARSSTGSSSEIEAGSGVPSAVRPSSSSQVRGVVRRRPRPRPPARLVRPRGLPDEPVRFDAPRRPPPRGERPRREPSPPPWQCETMAT